MGLFFGGERRAVIDPQPPIPPNSQAGTFSVRRVDLSRTDSAMQKIAIFSSINTIGNLPRMLPGNVFIGEGKEKRRLSTPSWLNDLGGTGHGLSDWLWQVVYCLGLRGNGVGKVVDRDPRTGQPRTIDLQHPDGVGVRKDRDSGLPLWRFGATDVDRGDVWHCRLFPTPGQTLGLSPIAVHALSIGLGLSAQQFGAQWFLDGAHPSSILSNPNAGPEQITQDAAQVVKQRFLNAVKGTREPVVLGGGWQYQAIQVAPAESQFLETQKYTSAECARIFGPGMPEILGYESGSSMTYTNQETRSLDLLTYTLDPWLVFLEGLVTSLLPTRQYYKFERKALLRTDTLTRFKVHEIALRNQVETVNEVRELEDQQPVPWGDVPQQAAPAAPPVPVSLENP